jgi:hypothetical protein
MVNCSGMKKIFTYTVLLIFLSSCGNASKQDSSAVEAAPADTLAPDRINPMPKQETLSYKDGNDSLLYEGETLSTYIDAEHRGAGVVSFTLDVNDRLDIWNMDDTKFGDVVLNEDLTYFSLNMPKKIVARKVVPENDFAAFDFDAEKPETDKDYLIIYINKEKRKVKKSDLKFHFSPWK